MKTFAIKFAVAVALLSIPAFGQINWIVASQPTLAPHDCFCGVSCKCDPCSCNVVSAPKPTSVMRLIPSGNCPGGQCSPQIASKAITVKSNTCPNGQCNQSPTPKPAAKVGSGDKLVSPAGGCSNGSCSRGPVRSVIAAQPVRRFGGWLFRRGR